MIRATFSAFAAVVISLSLVYACSSPTAPNAPMNMSADAHTDVAADTQMAADTLIDGGPLDAGNTTGDSGSASLDWFPGNYGLTDSTNTTARDAFLTGLSNAFDGVELIYPWTLCESGTVMGDYSACFTAIDGDLQQAKLANKHILLMLQYKDFVKGDAGVNAVPAYLRSGPGQWCATFDGSAPVCGQYPTPGAAIAMLWNPAVADRLHAWFTALGEYYGPTGNGHPLADRIAGIVLPETSVGAGGAYSLASVGYTAENYATAIEANLSLLNKAFPTKPVFQYINFLTQGMPSESAALESLGDFALKNPHVGLGCPDVGGDSTFHPPGYDTLINPKYQLHLPFNVAIEPMDYTSAFTAGLPETYAEATGLAQDGGMAAQFVVWWYAQGGGNVFTIDQVATYLLSHPDPNVARPDY